MTRRTVIALVLLAFVVRLGFMVAFQTYNFKGLDDFCKVGETSSIAASIARGHGFASPFGDEYTGPTAWIAPVYPYFLAGIYKVLGILSTPSTIVIFTLQGLFSALTVIPILGIAKRTVGIRAGIVASLAWALFPWFSKWAVTWEWEVALTALLLALILWAALGLGNNEGTLWAWVGFGALEGFALLTNPALATVLPVVLAWHLYQLRRRAWFKPVVACLACLVVMFPWIVRNRVAFDRWVFLRGNFGFEFALGNYHNSFGRGWGGFHPGGSLREYADYKREGEADYVAAKQKLGLRFVREYPGEFATLTLKRISYFWDGSPIGYRPRVAAHWLPGSFGLVSFLLLPGLWVAYRKNLQARSLLLGTLAVYPVPYYLTFSQSRYRHALEPLIVLLVAYAAVEVYGWVKSKLTKEAV